MKKTESTKAAIAKVEIYLGEAKTAIDAGDPAGAGLKLRQADDLLSIVRRQADAEQQAEEAGNAVEEAIATISTLETAATVTTEQPS